MAKLLKVGHPANDAERWAFDYLAKELPSHYVIISNVDVYSDTGQPFECDAIIVGDWAVYIVDVKGYQGRLEAGKDIWKFEERTIGNPLPKLHHNARILASRCKINTRRNQHAPWCQGLAFITGGVGGKIHIEKTDQNLPVFDWHCVIDALTNPEYITSYHKHKLESYQKEIALSAICDFKLLSEEENKVGNYVKKSHLGTKNDVELWIVEPDGHTFNFQYWMKYVDITGKPQNRITELRAQFRKEFYLLSELADLPTVPAALAFNDDGESLAIVHQNILGVPLAEATNYELPAVMQDVAKSLIDMADRGIYHRALSLENIYVTDDGKVQLLDVGFARSIDTQTIVSAHQLDNRWLPPEYIENGRYNDKSVAYQFALVFLPLITTSPPTSTSTIEFAAEEYQLDINSIEGPLTCIFEWLLGALSMQDSDRPDLNEFLDIFTVQPLNEQETPIEFVPRPNAKIGEKYELIDCIGRGGTSSIWRANHLIGEYVCCLKIVDMFDGSEEIAKKEFETLRTLYHPNIVRIFDLDIVPGNDQYFLTCEYLEGATLSDTNISSVTEGLEYFRQILNALQYLHRMGIFHKDVKPDNIIVSSGKASLIDFNLSLLDSRFVGTTRYKDPLVKTNGWTRFSDIYSAVIAFSEFLVGQHPFASNDEIPSTDVAPVISVLGSKLPNSNKAKFEQVLKREVNWDGIQDYSAWFGIADQIEIDVPGNILADWNINRGYMLKVLKVMLADMQPRSRQVIVRNTLKSNNIYGNRPNKGSVSSAVSALKTNNVVEEHGAKIRLTEKFKSAWENCQANLN